MNRAPRRLRDRLVLAAACAGSLLSGPASAHEGDPKVLDRKPAYRGPGYRRNEAVRGTGSPKSSPIDFPASGVTLLSWLPLDEFGPEFASANDCWGYTSPSGREYAILGLSDGTAFVEVTNPGSAEIVAVHAGPTSLWRDVKTYQDHAYAVSEGGGGIQVFDLSGIDAGTVLDLGENTSGVGTTASHNVAVDEVSGFLYRVGGTDFSPSIQDRGLRFFSLADPANPTYVGEWSDKYVHDAQVVTYTSGPYAGKQVAFCCSGFDGGITATGLDIVDVTDKGNPQVLGSVSYTNASYSHQAWLSADRQYLFLNDELDEDGAYPSTTVVFDVSDLSAPVEVSTFTNGSTAVTHNNYTRGDLLFAANYTNGMRVWDVSDVGSPEEIAFIDTWSDSDEESFNSLWSVYPYFPSGTVVGSDLEKGLYVWSVGDPALTLAVPGGPAAVVDSSGEVVTVEVAEVAGTLGGDVLLHVESSDGGFDAFAMQDLGGGLHSAALPSADCGSTVRYYFSAADQSGTVWSAPPGAPAACYEATAALSTAVAASYDMEAAAGWTSGAPGDDATTGLWERVDPVGTSAQPEDDHTPGGTVCWVTGQGSVFGGLGDDDVDGGRTTLLSPVLDLTGTEGAVVSYWRWFSNDQGSAANQDVFEVDVTDDGTTWVNVETVGPGGPESAGGWYPHQFRVSDHVELTDQVQVRFVAADEGDGSIVEAAVDDFTVTEVTCPPLTVDRGTVSVSGGGTQTFALDAGDGQAGKTYWILGTTTGTSPGLPLQSFVVPVNYDFYTQLTLTSFNSGLFTSTAGVLSGSGEGLGSFTLPAGSNPGLAGVLLHHAYFTFDAGSLTVESTSNPVSLHLVP